MRRTKIVCTIGPATQDLEVLAQLIAAGMNVARLNFSHGTPDSHRETIQRIRAAAARAGCAVGILADLQGPKIRVGTMVDAGVTLVEGQEANLTAEHVVGSTPSQLPVQWAGLVDVVAAGDQILIDDGLLELRVLSTSGDTIHCRVVTGGVLYSNKGVNLPHVSVEIPAITPKDRSDLALALEEEVDWIALSFVRCALDVVRLREMVTETARPGHTVPIMAKIEKPEAVENLSEILAVVDGIMVARGDLGIEMQPEMVPMAQKRIIRACNELGKPVVTATQMLDSMIRAPRPTRAEASDVANAVLDGTDAVMLSGETSIGAYPLAAVQTMSRIAAQAESALGQGAPELKSRTWLEGTMSVADAVSMAARDTAQALGAAAIITPTMSGYTAQLMSHHRPGAPIVAVTPDPRVCRRLSLYWGVLPLYAPRSENSDRMVTQAVSAAQGAQLVGEGDTVVVTAGSAGSAPGTTNLLRVYTVEREP